MFRLVTGLRQARPLVVTGMSMAALFFAGSVSAISQSAVYKSEKHDIRAVTVVDGLETPWGMAFLPDGGILVTERDGSLRVVRDGKLVETPIKGVPGVVARGQGGLLDVAVHPKFAENRLIYLSYAGGASGSVNTELARAKFDGKALSDVQVIFRAEPKTSGANHYGGRILFLPDGTLMLSLGDRYAYKDRAQTVDNHLGKVVRLKDDGTVPSDNPLTGKDGARPEIYSYGHRNVQGLALRPGTSNEVWEAEFGPRGGDEVNTLAPGANYGWPAITYGVDYSGAIISDKTQLPGMEQPVVYYVPSVSPSGIAFYDGDRFPAWKGNLLVAALSGHLRRLTLDGDKVTGQEKLLEKLGERIRDVEQAPDGSVYILTDDPSDGKLIQLQPAS